VEDEVRVYGLSAPDGKEPGIHRAHKALCPNVCPPFLPFAAQLSEDRGEQYVRGKYPGWPVSRWLKQS
jgi:hypothetical protein